MQTKTTLYLVRHGQTEWNVQHRFQGHQDSPLTEQGVRQAEWLAESMKHVHLDAIFASTSRRASHTAEIIRAEREIPIFETDDFRELNLGIWEGQTQDQAKCDSPEQFDNFWNDPEAFMVDGSEMFEQVRERAVRKLIELVQQYEGKSLMIVTHTVVVKLLMAHFENRALKDLWKLPYIHPTCLCKIEMTGDQANIILHGDTSHYKEEAKKS